MLLPRNGRIVVIDDKYEEALPLLRTLWQNGFAVIYFNGEKKYLPSVPLDDVRVIFLDMELLMGGYTDSNNKTKAATTANVLKSIINTKRNSVYLIVMWANHKELVHDFWTYIRTDSSCDFIELELDKTKCMTNEKILPDEIVAVLRNHNAFKFFINWENMIHKSSSDIILDFSSFFPVNAEAEWDRKMLGIFKKLAEEYAGKTLNATDHEETVKNAMCAFNGTFTDTLENNIAQVPNTGISFEGITAIPDQSVVAKINSKLLLDQNNAIAKPGSIYINNEEDVIQDYFSPGSDLSGIEKVFCEISPTCDYAQNKWKFHRILSGIKIKPEQGGHLRKKDADQIADYLYKTPVFDIGGQMFTFVFDLRKLKSKNLGDLDVLQPLSTFRHDLLINMQHKIANHCSRPGMLSL